LLRLFGRVDLDRYFDVQAGFDALVADALGQEVRITTPRGTDVRFTMAKPGIAKPRRAQQPGLYLIPGAVTMTPEIESVRGRIVLESVFHEFYTRLDEPISLEVDGRIRGVTGGGAERATLERALRRAGGGEYGYVIHFTHGLHPAARFTGRCFVEDMRAVGSDAVGLGLPWWQPGGGENHPDGVVSMQSVWLGGIQIVADGAIVAPAGLAAQAASLQERAP
jgi:leucyl aminopeptidase (aminopeptidase T)